VMGGGPIGCELAQAFSRLGSKVILITRSQRLLPKEDLEVSDYLLETFQREGIDVINNTEISQFRLDESEQYQAIVHGQTSPIYFSHLLLAVGRQANTEIPGIEKLALETNDNGTLVVNDYLQTRLPSVYACGDVVGPFQFTHAASHQAWYACVNALFGHCKKVRVNYDVSPWVTFTDPEVAHVGLNECMAKAQDTDYEITRYDISDLDRAITDNQAYGFVKVLSVPGKDKILGCTIVGSQAGNLLPEFVTAMKYNIGLNKILGTIHAYPTMSEANKYVAGEWKRNHVSPRTMAWLDKFHRWMRS